MKKTMGSYVNYANPTPKKTSVNGYMNQNYNEILLQTHENGEMKTDNIVSFGKNVKQTELPYRNSWFSLYCCFLVVHTSFHFFRNNYKLVQTLG